jgi:hypothetical protein
VCYREDCEKEKPLPELRPFEMEKEFECICGVPLKDEDGSPYYRLYKCGHLVHLECLKKEVLKDIGTDGIG